MALTYSEMMALGTTAPNFKLPNVVSGKTEHLNELKSSIATVICFICNHCPYVKHIKTELLKVARDYQAKGIHFIAISANDAHNYPQDGPEKMREEAENLHYPFPYLYDETQTVAKAYQAACTPDFYIFDSNLKCVYRGRFDDASPGNNAPVTGKDLTAALESILKGAAINPDQKPSMGCNIKWKS